MTGDLIEEFVELEKDVCDAPEIFFRGAGYHLVSNLLGRFFTSSEAKSDLLNLWIVLCSRPKVMRRSTIQKHHDIVYESAIRNFKDIDEWNERIFGKNPDDDKKYDSHRELIWDMKMENGSPEGITDHLDSTELSHYMISSNEFGGVLSRMRSGYGSGIQDLYSKLFYGEGGVARFSHKGSGKRTRVLPAGTYMTCYANMQDPTLYLKPEDAKQGFLRRLTLVYAEEKDKYEGFWGQGRDAGFGPDKHRKKLEELGEKFASRMKKYDGMDKIDKIQFGQKTLQTIPIIQKSQEVADKINAVGENVEKKLMEEGDIVSHYISGHDERLTKLTCLKAISRDKILEVDKGYIAHVSRDDVNEAYNGFLGPATERLKDKLPDINKKEKSPTSIKNVKKKISHKVNQQKGRVINFSELQNVGNFEHEPLVNNICTMVENGELVASVVRGTRGRGDNVKISTDENNLTDLMEDEGIPSKDDTEGDKWYWLFNKEKNVDTLHSLMSRS